MLSFKTNPMVIDFSSIPIFQKQMLINLYQGLGSRVVMVYKCQLTGEKSLCEEKSRYPENNGRSIFKPILGK